MSNLKRWRPKKSLAAHSSPATGAGSQTVNSETGGEVAEVDQGRLHGEGIAQGEEQERGGHSDLRDCVSKVKEAEPQSVRGGEPAGVGAGGRVDAERGSLGG